MLGGKFAGLWNDINCEEEHYRYFVCFGGDDQYVLITQYKKWRDAQSYCRANYIDLPSIRNATENEKVRVTANDYSVFIGLHQVRPWSDGSDSSFRYWKSGQPDQVQTCTAMSFSDAGQWTDENCATTLPFFCYGDRRTVATLRAVVKTTVELTEADIEDRVIKLLREELIRNGLPNSTSLSLRRINRANP
ncbi:aggrecan core protein-like [Engraulis encrasicolus]|uniref:aggrecan core protein-like n=1 Tax=Engraulis encrasicolus TaxID=184585 RepID=UPI002FD014CD